MKATEFEYSGTVKIVVLCSECDAELDAEVWVPSSGKYRGLTVIFVPTCDRCMAAEYERGAREAS